MNRNNTNVSILDRLGERGRSRTRNAPLQTRASSRARSASRGRSNLTRTNSKQNLANVQNAQRGRSASRQRAQPRQRSRSRSRNRVAAAAAKPAINTRNRLIRRRSRSNLRKVTSVNSRLGVRRQANANNGQNAKNGIRRGRIVKPRQNNVRNQVANGRNANAGGRQKIARSRSR